MDTREYAAEHVFVRPAIEDGHEVVLTMLIEEQASTGVPGQGTETCLATFPDEDAADSFARQVAHKIEWIVRHSFSVAKAGKLHVPGHPKVEDAVARFYGRSCSNCCFWSPIDGERGNCGATEKASSEFMVKLEPASAVMQTRKDFRCHQFQHREPDVEQD